MKIIVTGCKGQLGTELLKQLQEGRSELGPIPEKLLNATVIPVDLPELDISNYRMVDEFVRRNRPDIIINCAAYTNVDGCEVHHDDAFKANALGPRNLAQAAEKTGARLVHVSTDYVFSGRENGGVAQDEAIVRMKARVHDTIGQRLSILHRFLEAENPTPEALGEVKRLAGSIVDDLSEPETPDRASQLDSIVGAFALIGIEVCVKGSLPEDDDAASVFVNIVREAATNAAKHAQAKHVDVNISRIGNVTLLRVVNDGMPAPANLRMGCGIPGMRRAAEAIGGTFDVSSNDPFTIEVHLERPESAHAPSVRAVYEKELS